MTDLKIGCRYKVTIYFIDRPLTGIVWAIGSDNALIVWDDDECNPDGYAEWVPRSRLEPIS